MVTIKRGQGNKDWTERLPAPQGHHPWCNLFQAPRQGCEMCEGLYQRYPVNPEDSPEDLMARHFPGNVLVE